MMQIPHEIRIFANTSHLSLTGLFVEFNGIALWIWKRLIIISLVLYSYLRFSKTVYKTEAYFSIDRTHAINGELER